MEYNILLLEEAVADINESVTWYAGIDGKLVTRFVESLSETLNKIKTTPFRFQVVHNSFRKAIMKTFPFCIYFSCIEENIYIVAVHHTSRNPIIWKKRR